jgi:hypothetical protein
MTHQKMLGWAVLVAACCVGIVCIPYEEAREEFCHNADPARQQEICPRLPVGDGGTEPSPDAGTDGGTQPTGCKVQSDCQAPQAGSCFEAGACVEGRCVYPQKNDGSPCSGTPTAQCREPTGTCKSGVCEYTLRTSGSCDDRNLCTESDSCNSAGDCIGTAKVCNNTDPAMQCYEQTGICSLSTGTCVFAPKSINSTCNDGDACTLNDVCNGAGSCGGGRLDCSNPPTCRQWAGTCSNGMCNWGLKAPNSTCDDGNGCTRNDVCSSGGTCRGTAISCNNPPNQCHEWTGTCTASNECQYRPKQAGSPCEVGDQCTEDTCNASGQCVAGGAVACESTPCVTAIGCDANTGCVYDDWCTRNGWQCVDNCCRNDFGQCVIQ